MISSEVKIHNGVPSLFVNGSVIPANAYITYFTQRARYDDFAAAGYRLYSVPVYFATRGIQEMNEIPPFADGIFEKEEPDFSILDKAFEEILAVCPDAYIFPRVNITLPLRWENENPDELCDRGNLNPDRKRPCYGSDKWAEDTKKYIGMFIRHIEGSHYCDNVVGYQLASGNTEEWFPFDLDGSKGKRSREKFAQFVGNNNLSGTEEEYYAFISQLTAERICEFCEFAKNATKHRLVVGAFYGYTFEVPQRGWATFSATTVLNNKNVDFLCSPVSYMRGRELGIDHPNMLALESLKKHNKLYFVENDTRTHLSGPLFDVPHFTNSPNYKPRERWVSVENIKQHYARALTHSHAMWWFDMGGGWYHYAAYMEMMRDFLEITRQSLAKDMSSVSEVAVIADEKVVPTIHPNRHDTLYETLYNGRVNLGLMGTPYDTYLVEDYDDIKDKYKAFIILSPYLTQDLKKFSDNENCLVITYENHDITTDEIRTFLKGKNVHLYFEKDTVVYANRSYLFFHTTVHGRADIKLPAGKALKQIYGDKIDAETDILPRHTGYLFEITQMDE